MILQIPNCHLVFPDDPIQEPRKQDQILSFGWARYLRDENHDMRILPRLYMVKGSM